MEKKAVLLISLMCWSNVSPRFLAVEKSPSYRELLLLVQAGVNVEQGQWTASQLYQNLGGGDEVFGNGHLPLQAHIAEYHQRSSEN